MAIIVNSTGKIVTNSGKIVISGSSPVSGYTVTLTGSAVNLGGVEDKIYIFVNQLPNNPSISSSTNYSYRTANSSEYYGSSGDGIYKNNLPMPYTKVTQPVTISNVNYLYILADSGNYASYTVDGVETPFTPIVPPTPITLTKNITINLTGAVS